MNKKTNSHPAQSSILTKGATLSCLLVCSLVLAQHVAAEENLPSPNNTPTVTNTLQPEANSSSPETSSPDQPLAETPTPESTASLTEAPSSTEEKPLSPAEETTTDASTAESSTSQPEGTTSTLQPLATVAESPTTSENVTITETPATLYMDQENSVQVAAPTTSPLTWTIKDLPTMTYDMETGTFTKEELLTITSDPQGDLTNYTITMKPLFGSDLSLRWPNNIRRTYRDYIQTYVLKGVSADGKTIITKEITLRPYESYMTHEELQAEIDAIEKEHADDRLVKVETIGTSAQNNPIKMGIIAKDQASIDDYLSKTTPAMLTNPDEAMKHLAEGAFDYKLPILINNTHADEQPGIDVVRGLFEEFARKATIVYETVDANNLPQKIVLDVKQLLEKVILLFNFTENPDGDIANTRALANGLDPNRDTGYQTNPETKAIVEQITKWNPISVFDVHGFVKDFLIEPATPPHDPNFEYDIFEEDLVAEANAMGRAGITNSKYDHYIIPKYYYGSGWDDSFSGYTAVYALYHGILGHTIEIPETNQDSYKAGLYAVLAGIHYALENSDRLMKNRLTYYSRGVNKVEAPSAETPLVTTDGSVKGRIRQDGQANFFPDYYVIPMELSANNDIDQSFKMIDYFRRNGVLLSQLTEDTAGYKKGDLVIDMAQAKRGYANHVMYKGSDESEWAEMYAELVMNFPDMRGFKSEAVYTADLFKDKLGPVTLSQAPRSAAVEDTPYYFLANNSLAAVQAVNAAIRGGKSVYLTNDGYIIDSKTFKEMIGNYPLYAEPFYKKPVGKTLTAMKVYSPGNPNISLGFPSVSEATLGLKQMGFDVVTSLDEADVVVLDNGQFDASVFGKKPVIIIGGEAMARLEKLGLLAGFDAETMAARNAGSYEGLMRIKLDDQSPYTSGYKADTLYYANSGSWIAGIPSNFKVLANIQGGNFYVSGWWPGHEELAGKNVAISGSYMDQPIFIFAGNPLNKTHTLNFYRWVSNAIFGTELANFEDLPQATPKPITTDKPAPLAYQPQATRPTTPAKTLPKTGQASSPILVIAGAMLAFGSCFLLKDKKEEN
ncbi:LPXTG cell wall anchor domain-containing protein [Streptococcus sp. 20-1249]|uniref:LPXTG cell wall anchor domain-containing protein n=1 Tax=Streptococcus hepaticus TaxID=3349163 RepID=UPI003747BBE5